jgi:hypothetical protein
LCDSGRSDSKNKNGSRDGCQSRSTCHPGLLGPRFQATPPAPMVSTPRQTQ